MELLSSGTVCTLAEMPDHLPECGFYRVGLQQNHQEVDLTLRLQADAVHIHPPKDLSVKKHQIENLSLVIAQAVSCVVVDSNQEVVMDELPVWCLLTSLPIANHFYALR